MSDDEQREHLDSLRAVLEANGAARPKDEPYQPPPDEQVIERCRAILADESAPDWKREAARTQLELMRAL